MRPWRCSIADVSQALIRRIVTGHLPDGRSTVLLDGPAPNVKQRKAGNASTLSDRNGSATKGIAANSTEAAHRPA